MKDYKKTRAPVENSRLRIIVMAIISIGLFSFVLGYWAANWFFVDDEVAQKNESGKESMLLGATPKKLDANQIINETEVVVVPKDALKKGEEKFSFTQTLERESAPAVDPFKNQKPAPVTPAKEKDVKEKEKEKIVKNAKKKKAPVKKRIKKPTKKKKVASAKPVKGKVFTVQVGSFASEKDAVKLQKRLKKKGYNALVARANVKGKTMRRVQVGSFKTRSAAGRMAAKLKKNEKLPTYITTTRR